MRFVSDGRQVRKQTTLNRYNAKQGLGNHQVIRDPARINESALLESTSLVNMSNQGNPPSRDYQTHQIYETETVSLLCQITCKLTKGVSHTEHKLMSPPWS